MHARTSSVGGAQAPVLPALISQLRLLAKKKWTLLIAALVMAAIAALIVFRVLTPVYRAAATLLIESKLATVVEITDVYGRASGDREYFQTQIEFIRSRPVVERVVDRLRLDKHPLFDPRQSPPSRTHRLLNALGLDADRLLEDEASTVAAALTPERARAAAVDSVARSLGVRPVGLSQMIEVRFDSPDALLAAEVSNAAAQAYIDAEIATRYNASEDAGGLLEQQIIELKTKLESSELALQRYLEANGLLDRESAIAGGVAVQLSELGRRLVEAQQRRVAAEQAWRQVQGAGAATAPQVLSNESVIRARNALTAAERELEEAGQRYGSAHPQQRAAATRASAARADLNRSIASVAAGLRKEYRAAVGTERALEAQQNSARDSIQGQNRRGIDRVTLEREVETNRTLYQTLLARKKETEATRQLQTAGARIIEPAIVPNGPIRPNRPLSILLAALLGFGAAAAWILLRGRLDDTIRRRSDVPDLLDQSVLSALPKLKKPMSEQAGRLVSAYPNTVYAEAMRDAAAGVLLAAAGRKGHVVAVTSTLPGEGKTTFSANLAQALAITSSKRILLIEGDMRKPRLIDALGLPEREAGLSGLLAGTARFDEAVHKIEATGLHVAACGRVPSNPVARLQPNRLGQLLKACRKVYDVIIIDCPPLQLVSDALTIGKQADGTVYVIKAGATPLPLVRQGLGRLSAAAVPVMGVALNHHDFEQAERYYGEYSAHGKYGDAYYGAYGDGEFAATQFGN